MVGAVTTLILIVAVFLAYNANNGLPFVPVYSVSVDVPNAARLGENNEVRIGGTRVGVVESIEPIDLNESDTTASTEGDESAGDVPELGARLNLKLDKAAEPLPVDSVFRVRYRSTFGLKYLEIVRGTGPDADEGHIFDGTNDGDACRVRHPHRSGDLLRARSPSRPRTAASRSRPSSTPSTTPSTTRREPLRVRTSWASAARLPGAGHR